MAKFETAIYDMAGQRVDGCGGRLSVTGVDGVHVSVCPHSYASADLQVCTLDICRLEFVQA